jgi:hypothetical protein
MIRISGQRLGRLVKTLGWSKRQQPPEGHTAARLKLADIVLSLAKQSDFDPQWLADTAVQVARSRSAGFRG